MKKVICILLFLSFAYKIGDAQSASILNTRTVIDTVKCKSNTRFSYALYLPSNYKPDKLWPVIFIYDPGGRGVLGIKNFIPAANKYGYILTCSNNSRNGMPWDEVLMVSNAMIEDVKNKLSVDNNRTYTSGLSGGSRVASFIALNDSGIAGVIGCAAGFPASIELIESPTFDYFGLIGYRDCNYHEMIELEQQLKGYKMNVRIQPSDTGHVWASENEIMDAVEWMELQAMKKGVIPRNNSYIQNQYNKLLLKAKKNKVQGDLTEAVKNYNYIIDEFKDYTEIQNIVWLIDSIENTKEYKKETRELLKLRSTEDKLVISFYNSLQNIAIEPSLPDSVNNWWISEIQKLHKMEKSSDKKNQYMASRILVYLKMIFNETGRNYMNIKEYGKAGTVYQLLTYVEPDNQWAWFNLAQAYSYDKKTGEAQRAIENAIKSGFNDTNILYNDPAFVNLRNEKRFKSMMAEMQN